MKNNKAVSQVVGFVLTFVIISAATATIIYSTSVLADRRLKEVTYIIAQDIANYVVNAITEALSFKQNYMLSNYSCTLEVPEKINGRNYYIEATQDYVYVNVSNGVSVKCSTFKQGEVLYPISGRVYPQNGKIKIWCNSSEEIHLLDFGTQYANESPAETRYIRVSNSTIGNWADPYQDWLFRLKIVIYNPSQYDLHDYPVRIVLTPDNYGYYYGRTDGADIRFSNSTGSSLSYWIERWEHLGVSIVWVKVDLIPANNSTAIYLYYGNYSATTESNGEKVFEFFDDFTFFNSSKWYVPSDQSGVEIRDGYLILKGGAFLVSRLDNFSDGIIETKVKVIQKSESENADGNIFTRCVDIADPLNNSYLLFSGIFHGSEWYKNFTEGKYNDLIQNENVAIPIKNNTWYRLQFINMGGVLIGLRSEYYGEAEYYTRVYRYDAIDFREGNFGVFNSQNCTTIYDWVAWRKGGISVSVDILSPESKLYGWQPYCIPSLKMFNTSTPDNLHRDGIYSDGDAIFTILIPNGVYSVYMDIGNPDYQVNVSIVVNGETLLDNLRIDPGTTLRKVIYVNVQDGRMDIQFIPNNGAVWSIYCIRIVDGMDGIFIGRG